MWGGPFNWEEFEDDGDWAEDDFDDLDYLDSLHHEEFPVFSPLTWLFPVVERIREYTGDNLDRYTPDVVREIEAVEAYIELGFEQLEAYLACHNEFTTYLQEQGIE